MNLNDRVALLLGQLQLQVLQLQELVDTLQQQLEEQNGDNDQSKVS
jgi:hypothetical protein